MAFYHGYGSEEQFGKNDPSMLSSDEEDLDVGEYGRHRSTLSSDSFETSRHVYGGRGTDRFLGDFESDEEEEEEEGNDEPAELVTLGRSFCGGSRSRSQRSTARKSVTQMGFYDYYKTTSEHLGSGAYGSVMTCTSIATGKEYAVKVVSKSDETHTRSRILREVHIFNLCKHQPNIVQLIDWFEDDEHFYMVMEKMRGGPLLQHILARGYFTEEEARKVTKEIASALKFLHDRGIAHRDVKPENILCTEPDHVSPVKLCDLDLASRPSKQEVQMSQSTMEPDLASPVGSAEFMAPEVVDAFCGDALKYDKRCDMWSLGVILYIMLCGYAPFQGQCADEECGWMDGQPCDECQQDLFSTIQLGQYDFPEEEWGMISADAKDLVAHLLVKNVSNRFTADQVLSHPWVQQYAPQTILQTPSNLYRKDSARDVQQMVEHFNVMNRIVAARLSARMETMVGGPDADIKHAMSGPFLTLGGPIDPSTDHFQSLLTERPLPGLLAKQQPLFVQISTPGPTTPPPSVIDSPLTSSTSPVCVVPQQKELPSFAMFSTPPLSAGRTTTLFFGQDGAQGGGRDDSLVPDCSNFSALSLQEPLPRNSSKGEVGEPPVPSPETCQEAMAAARDSMPDMLQASRETEVNV